MTLHALREKFPSLKIRQPDDDAVTEVIFLQRPQMPKPKLKPNEPKQKT